MGLLVPAGVPAGPIYGIDETFTDRHVVSTNRVQELEHPILGTLRQTTAAISFNGQTLPATPPPLLGQHTTEILEQFGFPSAEISELVKSGVVRTNSAMTP